MTASETLQTLETYYDAAPRPSATAEEVGPFTVFVRTDPAGWPFYARPRLGLDVVFTAADVAKVRDRQRELGVPENIEWVYQTTPSLLEAARGDMMSVDECPLLVLPTGASTALPATGGTRVAVLDPDSADLATVAGAIHAGFAGTDELAALDPRHQAEKMRSGLLVVVGAYDERGNVIGGGSHSPRGDTTELTGIAVLPRARRRGAGAAITHALVEDARQRGAATIFLAAQNDAVARVYERVGFTRVGIACIAEAPKINPVGPVGQ